MLELKMTGWTKRLEISFWTLCIALMHNRKAIRIFVILSCCFIFLLTISISLFIVDIIAGAAFEPNAVSSSPVNAVETNTSQKNILIIFAENLDQEDPNLSGVWLAVFQPSKTRLIFLPVYPSLEKYGKIDSHDLADYFRVDPNGIPTAEFYNFIGQKDLWWDQVVILDKFSLGKLIEINGSLDLSQGKLAGPAAVSEFTINQEEPQATQFAQAIVLRGLCQETGNLLKVAFTDEEFRALSGHWYSDLDFESIKSNSSLDYWIKGLSCDVPVLQEVSLNQIFSK